MFFLSRYYVHSLDYSPRMDFGQILRSQLPVALRRETPHSIRAVSGAPLSSSGLEEAL